MNLNEQFARTREISGERARLARGVWRLAKHIFVRCPAANGETQRIHALNYDGGEKRGEVRRETHRTATGTVALPNHPNPTLNLNPDLAAAGRRGVESVALVITLLMLSVITGLAIAFLAMSRRNQAAVSASLDVAAARAMCDGAQARAQAEIMAQMLAHGDPLYYDYMVSRDYISPAGFNNAEKGVYDPTNVNYEYVYSPSRIYTPFNPANAPVGWVQNIANLYYDPRPPVFVVTNSYPTNQYDFRFWVDINRNGRFETNGYQLIFNDVGVPVGSSFLNGEPEFIGVLRNPLVHHSYTNQFIGRYAYLVLPIGKTLDFNYIHNFLKSTYAPAQMGVLTNTSGVPVPGENDGFARDQGIGSWELNLAGLLEAVSPWAYESNNNLYPGYLTRYSPYHYVPPNPSRYNLGLANGGNAFDDAEAILHYRYMPPYYNLAMASLGHDFPIYLKFLNYLDFQNNYMDMYCVAAPMTAPFDYGTNDPAQPYLRPWAGGYQTNLFFDVQDLFDTNKTSANFTNRMILAAQRTNTFDRYTFQRLLSCIGMGSSPEYGAWVYADYVGLPPDPGKLTLRTKVNINYDNTAQINSPNAPYAPMPTNLVSWTNGLKFFTNAAELLLRSQTFLYTNYLGTNTNFLLAPIVAHFGVTNIPIYSASNPGIRYNPAVHRMLQLAANIHDATVTNQYASAYGPVRHPSVFRPLFRISNPGPGTINTVLYITNYVQVANANDAYTNMLRPFLDMSSVTNGFLNNNNVNHYNFAGIPWVVGANKGLPEFYRYTCESAVLLERKLLFRRNIVGGIVQSNQPPASTNQFYCMAITNTIGMDAWNSYPTPFSGSNGNTYYYFSNYITIQLTNQYNHGFYSNIVVSTVPPYFYSAPGGYYGPFSWNAAQVNPTVGSPSGFVTMYVNSNVVAMPPAYYSESLPGFSFVTNGIITSNSFLPGDMSQAHWPVYNWTLNVTNHVVYALFDGPPNSTGSALLDFVNLGPFGSSVSLTQLVEQVNNGPGGVLGTGGGGGATYNYWIPQPATSLPNSPMSLGVLNQILAGETNLTFLDNLLGKGAQLSGDAVIECPVVPTYLVQQPAEWVANDPLVHYTLEDLTWAGNPNQPQAVDITSHVPLPLPNAIGKVSARYAPWGAGSGNVASVATDLLFKDPQMTSSAFWQFPTNKFPGVGWIGRVHRGTPWQTVYLKADFNPAGTSQYMWTNWVTSPWFGPPFYLDAFGRPYEPTPETYPTNDWALVDVFTATPNDNAARGLLSVNQTNAAAWAAVFAGVIAPTNDIGGIPITPIADVQYLMDGVGAGPGTNGINAIRWLQNNGLPLHPNGVLHKVGDILAAQTLTTYSPYLGASPANASFYPDEIVERIPQQTLSLLKVGEPQFVIFSWGQSLKPKGPPYLGGGPNNNIYTNYEITGECLTRTVCHLVHTNGLKMIIDSYNVESGN